MLGRFLLAFFSGAPFLCEAASGVGDLYCGNDECYSLLDVTRDAEAADIKKAYRKLALKWHPDKNKSPEAPKRFQKISRAHEVLSDEKLRKAYNYFLDHPDERYAHYYQYYNAAYAPETPLWAVISGFLAFVSMLQFINQNWRYSSTMRAIKYQPSFKRRVNTVLEEEAATYKGKLSRIERELLREKVEVKVMSEVQLTGSGASPISLRQLLMVRAVFLPVSIANYLYETFRWHWRFNWKKEEYGDEEREYLTRRVLGIAQGGWESLDDARKIDLLSRRLYETGQMEAFRKEQHEEMMAKRAQSGAYKRAKRWMKNH